MAKPDQETVSQATFIDSQGNVIPQRIPTLDEVRSRLPEYHVTEAIYIRLTPLLKSGHSIDKALSIIRKEDSEPDHPWANTAKPRTSRRR